MQQLTKASCWISRRQRETEKGRETDFVIKQASGELVAAGAVGAGGDFSE